MNAQPKEFKIGDRVQLRASYNIRNRTLKKIDWSSRQGSVTRIGMFNNMITVKWDGRESVDQWPRSALKKIDDP